MFSNYESTVIGFDSSWEQSIELIENESQTEPVQTAEKESTADFCRHISIQTDPVESTSVRNESSERLEKWLKNIAPKVLEELQRDDVGAFSGYDPYEKLDEKSDIKFRSIKTLQLYSSNDDASKISAENVEKPPISSLSWNSNGSMLAAANGFFYHDCWCQHNAVVTIFNNRRNNDEYKQIHEIKLHSCVTSAIFHPSDANLLGTASYTGEVSIWNLLHIQDASNQDILIASNSISHSGKPVPCMLWLNTDQKNRYFPQMKNFSSEMILVTGGSDNKINVWSVDSISSSIKVLMSFEIKPSPDICCIDFCLVWGKKHEKTSLYERSDKDDYFVIGSKTGEIHICETSIANNLKGLLQMDPSVGALLSHNGTILSLKFCPDKPRRLLSLGADQELRVYDILMSAPIQILFLEREFSSADWFGKDGSSVLGALVHVESKERVSRFMIFDVIKKEETSIEEVSGEKTIEDGVGVTIFTFNKNAPNKLASGDMRGRVKIWHRQNSSRMDEEI